MKSFTDLFLFLALSDHETFSSKGGEEQRTEKRLCTQWAKKNE